jgi:hypothetical protein
MGERRDREEREEREERGQRGQRGQRRGERGKRREIRRRHLVGCVNLRVDATAGAFGDIVVVVLVRAAVRAGSKRRCSVQGPVSTAGSRWLKNVVASDGNRGFQFKGECLRRGEHCRSSVV